MKEEIAMSFLDTINEAFTNNNGTASSTGNAIRAYSDNAEGATLVLCATAVA
jgi:hypothetical protein